MAGNTIGIVMNGVTGRMGLNQHLVRSIVAIRQQGGVPMPDGTRLMPDPILVGRDERKLRGLAEQYGIQLVSMAMICHSTRSWSSNRRRARSLAFSGAPWCRPCGVWESNPGGTSTPNTLPPWKNATSSWSALRWYQG